MATIQQNHKAFVELEIAYKTRGGSAELMCQRVIVMMVLPLRWGGENYIIANQLKKPRYLYYFHISTMILCCIICYEQNLQQRLLYKTFLTGCTRKKPSVFLKLVLIQSLVGCGGTSKKVIY